MTRLTRRVDHAYISTAKRFSSTRNIPNPVAITRRDKTGSGRRLPEPKVAMQAAEPLPVI